MRSTGAFSLFLREDLNMTHFSFQKLFATQKRIAQRQRPRLQPRPCLEELENRLVPSTLHVGSSPGEFTTIQAAVNAAHSNDTTYIPHNSGSIFLRFCLVISAHTRRHPRPRVQEPDQPPPVTHHGRYAATPRSRRIADDADAPPTPQTPARSSVSR